MKSLQESASKFQSESNEEQTVRTAVKMLIGRYNGDLRKTADTLARYFAKERDAVITDNDYSDADKLVQEVSTGTYTGVIAEVFKPVGGAERFSNLRSPGMHSGKVVASPAQAGYGHRGGTDSADTEDFTDTSEGMSHSDAGTRGDKSEQRPRARTRASGQDISEGRDTQRTGYGTQSEGVSSPRDYSYGRRAEVRSGAGYDPKPLGKQLSFILPTQGSGDEHVTLQKDVGKLEGLAVETRGGRVVEPKNQAFTKTIEIIEDSRMVFPTDQRVAAELRKRKDLDLTKGA